MPQYTYECQECLHKFETEHSMNRDPLKTCPECNKESLERLIVATSFVLQGNGWARDNYSSVNTGEKSKKNSSNES